MYDLTQSKGTNRKIKIKCSKVFTSIAFLLLQVLNSRAPSVDLIKSRTLIMISFSNLVCLLANCLLGFALKQCFLSDHAYIFVERIYFIKFN